jgi:hypothetical protein
MPKLSSTRITDKAVKNVKPRDKTYDIRASSQAKEY